MKASLVLTLLVVACFVARMESASGVVVGLLGGGGVEVTRAQVGK